MYRNSESYSVVKKILLDAVPHVEVIKTREEGTVLIVVNRQKKFFILNEVAKDFLLLCDGQRRLKEIIDALGEIYDVEKKLLTDDLIDMIQDLQYKRVLRMEAT